MRYIKRMPEPEILSKKKKEWTEKFIASENDRPQNSQYAHSDVKSLLFTMSHNKCYFCETIIKGNSSEIDHFIEVTERKDLSFEWTNLYVSCPHCNKKIPNTSISVTDVLDPCRDTDEKIEKHIAFENEQITFLTLKGEKTIQKYRLSSESLDSLRTKELLLFYKGLNKIKDKMIDEGRKNMTESEIEILRRFSRSDYSYSLMFKQILRKYSI